MKKDASNTWLNEKGLQQVESYTSSSDFIVVERYRAIKIMIDLFSYHFEERKNLKLLDFGCGDGVLTRNIVKRFPDNQFYLLDGCTAMLDKARLELSDERFRFIHQTFEEYIDQPVEQKYDFIFSSNAIHHMDYLGKLQLYSKMYKDLEFGGMFINLDIVHPHSDHLEKLQFRMWVDWINENLAKNGFTDEVGKYDSTPSSYKNKDENKPTSLSEQLGMLTKAGFRNVDCFYKYGIFTVFGGTK